MLSRAKVTPQKLKSFAANGWPSCTGRELFEIAELAGRRHVDNRGARGKADGVVAVLLARHEHRDGADRPSGTRVCASARPQLQGRPRVKLRVEECRRERRHHPDVRLQTDAAIMRKRDAVALEGRRRPRTHRTGERREFDRGAVLDAGASREEDVRLRGDRRRIRVALDGVDTGRLVRARSRTQNRKREQRGCRDQQRRDRPNRPFRSCHRGILPSIPATIPRMQKRARIATAAVTAVLLVPVRAQQTPAQASGTTAQHARAVKRLLIRNAMVIPGHRSTRLRAARPPGRRRHDRADGKRRRGEVAARPTR